VYSLRFRAYSCVTNNNESPLCIALLCIYSHFGSVKEHWCQANLTCVKLLKNQAFFFVLYLQLAGFQVYQCRYNLAVHLPAVHRLQLLQSMVFFIFISWPPSLTLLPYLWAVAMYASIQIPACRYRILDLDVLHVQSHIWSLWHCFAWVSWLPRIPSFLSQAFVMNQLLRTSLVFLKKSYSPHRRREPQKTTQIFLQNGGQSGEQIYILCKLQSLGDTP